MMNSLLQNKIFIFEAVREAITTKNDINNETFRSYFISAEKSYEVLKKDQTEDINNQPADNSSHSFKEIIFKIFLNTIHLDWR